MRAIETSRRTDSSLPQAADEPRKGQAFDFANFFVLRTPLLPCEALQDLVPRNSPNPPVLHAGEQTIEAAIRDTFRSPLIREALALASPVLHRELFTRESDGPETWTERSYIALLKYLARMATRPTPFGLFAGISTGSTSALTCMDLGSSADYRRCVRVDTSYLASVTERLCQQAEVRRELAFHINDSMHATRTSYRYVETRRVGQRTLQFMVEARRNEELDCVVRAAQQPTKFAVIGEALMQSCGAREWDDIEGFLNELVTAQILVAEIQSVVTGEDPLEYLRESLPSCAGATHWRTALTEINTAVAVLNSTPLGSQREQYEIARRALLAASSSNASGDVFHAALVKPGRRLELGMDTRAAILEGLETLDLLADQESDGFLHFRSAFEERYGDAVVPLLEALDEDIGIGYPPSSGMTADAAGLLEELGLPANGAFGSGSPQHSSERFAHIVEVTTEAIGQGQSQVSIDLPRLRALSSARRLPLPDVISAVGSILAPNDDVSPLFHLQYIKGGSVASMLGRFSNCDSRLLHELRRLHMAEERLRPKVIFAEIAHIPPGRAGNIVMRPVLRSYEIPYLGRSGAPLDMQIPVQDLHVSLRRGRIVLHSSRWGREVVPRLASAHNHRASEDCVYRFLGDLQYQGTLSVLKWQWGQLEYAGALPRVVVGRTVLSPARWRLAAPEVRQVGRSYHRTNWDAVERLREKHGLPRFVCVGTGDQQLTCDLENAISVQALARAGAGTTGLVVSESLTASLGSGVSGAEGTFANECVVALTRRCAHERSSSLKVGEFETRRTLQQHGDRWLYVKLYGSEGSADRVLIDLVWPFLSRVCATSKAGTWFFVRYADPRPHLRVRVLLESEADRGRWFSKLRRAGTGLCEAGYLWRIERARYQPETTRYGGSSGLKLAERLFEADSRCVLRLISLGSDGELLAGRWRLGMLAQHTLLKAFEPDPARRQAVMQRHFEDLSNEFDLSHRHVVGLDLRWRNERRELEAALGGESASWTSRLSQLERILKDYEAEVAPIRGAMLKEGPIERHGADDWDGLRSFVHMQANRLFQSRQKEQELVIAYFLSRYYRSQVIREQTARESSGSER